MVAFGLLIVACLLITGGVLMVSVPAAVIVAGVLLAGVVMLVDDQVFKGRG